MPNIYWIDQNRFDEKIDKSTWLEISETLIDAKYSVTLLCGFRNKKYHPEKYRIRIEYFKALHIGGLFRYSLLTNIFIWLVKRVKQDDIVIISPGALVVGFFLKAFKKSNIHLDVRTVHIEVNSIRDRIDYLLFWVLPLKFFNNVPDSISFITELMKYSVEQEFKVTFSDYVTWHSGVNIGYFSIVEKNDSKEGNRFVITYLGVLTKNRGIDHVLEALSKLKRIYRKNILFNVIGDGPDLVNLKKISLELGITEMVDFKGYIEYEFVPENLQNTDCFICPLPDRPEWNVSSPIKVFEYLACGKPVILTPIAAHRKILQNQNFIVWTEGDKIKDFIKAIEYAFNNRIVISEAAKKAPDFVRKKYEWKVQGKKFADYLKKKYCASN